MTTEQKEIIKKLYASIQEEERGLITQLKNTALMQSIQLGDYTWSAFDKDESGNTYFLLDPEFVGIENFGDNSNYMSSNARIYANNCDASKQALNILGKESFEPVKLDLLSHDGSGSYGICKSDLFGVRTYDMQRKNYKTIKRCSMPEYLSTSESTEDGWSTCCVQYVLSDGGVRFGGCRWDGGGVRPFFILKS